MHDPNPTPADPTPPNTAETVPTTDAPPAPPPSEEPAAEAAGEVGVEPAAAAATRTEPSLADTARLLGEHFPALFGAGVVKPVKLRIQADIQQRTPGIFTKKALSLFLHRHTTGSAYLRALLAAETRFDLDGQPAGEIAAEHKEAARVEVERRRAIVEAKKEAGRAAARAAREAARPPRPPRPPLPAAGPGESPSADGSRPDPRPPRPDRGPRPGGPNEGRPPRHREGPRADRPRQGDRPDRPGRPERRPEQPRRPERAERPERAPRPAHDDRPPQLEAPAVPLTPEQAAEAEARRQRAQLLRAFEQSPLSKANFGALKGLTETALEALLAQARADRERR